MGLIEIPKHSLQLLKSLVSVHGFGGSELTENLNCPTSKVNERKVTLSRLRHPPSAIAYGGGRSSRRLRADFAKALAATAERLKR